MDGEYQPSQHPNRALSMPLSARESVADGVDESHAPFLDRFLVKCVLGEGSYGKVKLAYDLECNRLVALKIVQKANLIKATHITRLKREVRIMKLLHHPNIARLYDVLETEKEIVLMMEHVGGGELFDYIVAHKRLKERIARRLFRQIVSAVDYCHQSSVIHRDLKPENLLLSTDKNIKIIDFGFVKLFDRHDMLKTFCGSPFYASPEMIMGKQYEGPEVDVWSMGVILYALLNGYLPFRDSNNSELYRKISNGIYETRTPYMSAGSADLIKKMLTVNPAQRATVEQIRRHPWVSEGCEGPPEALIPLRPSPILRPDPSILESFPMYGLESPRADEPLVNSGESASSFSLYCLLVESAEFESREAQTPPAAIPEPEDYMSAHTSGHPKQDEPTRTLHRRASRRRSTLGGGHEDATTKAARESRGPAAYGSEYSARMQAEEEQGGENSSAPVPYGLRRRGSLNVGRAPASPPEAGPPVRARHSSLPRDPGNPRGYMGEDGGKAYAGEDGSPVGRMGSGPVAGSTTLQIPPIHAPATTVATKSRRKSALHSQIISVLAGSRLESNSGSQRLDGSESPSTPGSSTPGTSTPTRDRKRSITETVSSALQKLRPLSARSRRNSTHGLGGPIPAAPRLSKAIFAADTTSTKSPDDILREIERVLHASGIRHTTTGYKITCTAPQASFEIEICRIKNTNMHGVEMKRTKGSSAAYQTLCRTLVSQWKL